MFIAGIAGMENTAVTAASVIGEPSGCRTVTSIVLSPDFGGSGSLRKSIVTPWLEVAAGAGGRACPSLLLAAGGWPCPQPAVNIGYDEPRPNRYPDPCDHDCSPLT